MNSYMSCIILNSIAIFSFGIFTFIFYKKRKEQKKTALRLKELEEKLEDTLELAIDSIFLCNKDSAIIDVNSFASELTGYSKEELISKNIKELFTSDSMFKKPLRYDLLLKGEIITNERDIMRKDGSIISIEMRAKIMHNGTHQVFMHNISDRKRKEIAIKESEERYRNTIEMAVDSIILGDDKGNLIGANSCACELTGYTKEELLTKNIKDLFKPEILDQKPLRYDLLRDGEIITNERTILRKDGIEIPIEMRSKRMPDGTHQAFIRDITERKKADEIRKENEKQLQELNASKDKLFSIIAHDLRGPFHSILGFSELLCDNIQEYEPEETKELLDIINSSAKNTLYLLNNLLDWAKSQTGQIDFKPKKIALTPTIQEIINVSDSTAKIKNIDINFLQLETDIEVFADANMLKTVLRNLISNAIKFTDAGGKIDIHATPIENHIEISVSDNGIGMNDETIENLFNIDTNISTRGTANEKGTGLGLILCKDFIEKHGGSLKIESKLGVGSNLKFTIPLSRV